MNLSAPFISRPVMTTFVMLTILIAGMIAYFRLPVSDLPNIEKPRLGVTAVYTGAPPETMVNMVTIPLEKELMNVSGVKELSSGSTRGHTSIDLEFDFDKNMDEAVRDVQAAINRAEAVLPKDMDYRPLYHKREANNQHIMYLMLTSPSSSLADLRSYSDIHIQPRLSRIEGVAKVDAYGAPYAIRIKLNPIVMAARHVGLDQVLQAIREHNSDIPLGSIKTGTRMLTLELPGKLQNAKDFGNLVVAPGPVYLKDIGTVMDTAESDREYHYVTKEANTVAMILGVKKLSGANTVSISEAINKILPQIQRELPPSMQLELWFDKAIWIHESIVDVQLSLFFAFALVILVIFFSLGRVSEAIIPGLSLPMSLIGTFIIMYALGYSLDILSLLALTLSVGFVVDDAIVVLENIVRHNEKGESPMHASYMGSKEICFTVLSMTLSLVAVFIPLLFLGGIHGKLFREFSVTLAVAILVSGFISLSLTPMLCSRLLSKHPHPTPLQIKLKALNERMVRRYEKTLRWALGHPKTILAIAFACLAATVSLFQHLPINLFPEEDRGFAWAVVNLPKGISSPRAKEYQKKVETLLQRYPHIDSFVDISLENSQLFLIRMVPVNSRPSQTEIMKELQEAINEIPGTQTFMVGVQLINMNREIIGGGNYQFLLRGMDFKDLETSAEDLKKKMQDSGEFPYVSLNLKQDEPKLIVKVQEEQAQKFGISKKDIQSILQQAFSGGSVAHIEKGGNRYQVYMELEEEFQSNPDALAKLHLTTSKGATIPLKALAAWSESLGFPTLNRVDQLPSITMSFSLNKDTPVKEGLDFLEKMARETLPSTVTGKLQGTAAMVASTLKDSTMLILASVLVMYVVLGILYESFIHPVTILSSLPFACLGGVLTLMIFGESLSLFSIVGFLLLIGIVKKNGIMMVDYALESRKHKPLTAEEAIMEGCLVRFRPIMMTTVAAIMGALPIAIGIGDGSDLRRGLGLVIAGGLLFSQLFTLYVTPVIYLTLERLRRVRSAELTEEAV